MNMSSYIILWILLCCCLHRHWCVRCLNHLFMKHNHSLLLFLFIHRLEEIPQFHLLLFSVILSKMKINPLFYVRCVLMRVCVSWSFWSRRVWDYVIQWITSLDYVTFLSIILNIKFKLLSFFVENYVFSFSMLSYLNCIRTLECNVDCTVYFGSRSTIVMSKGVWSFDFGNRYVNKEYQMPQYM